MSPSLRPNATQRILLDLVEYDPSKIYPMLRRFAAAGDLEVLRQALDVGVPQKLSSTNSAIFAVVAPLRMTVFDRRAAEDLITEWYVACGRPGQEQMDWALSTVTERGAAQDLVSMGANPNAWIDTGSTPVHTPIARALDNGPQSSMEVMLKTVAQRGELPFYERTANTRDGTIEEKTLFDLFAAAATNRGNWNAEGLTMELLRVMGTPHSWSLEMGRALTRELKEGTFNLLGLGLTIATDVLTLCAFDDVEQWYSVIGKTPALVDDAFRDTDAHSGLLAMIKRAIDDGADIDRIPSFVRGLVKSDVAADRWVYVPITLLQSAVLYKRPELAKEFIGLGADLDVTFPDTQCIPDGLAGATLVQAAQKYGDAEMEQILSSALAKRRIDEVLAQASQGTSSTSPRQPHCHGR